MAAARVPDLSIVFVALPCMTRVLRVYLWHMLPELLFCEVGCARLSPLARSLTRSQVVSVMWEYLLAVILVIFTLFITVFNLLGFDELLHDHANPSDVCKNLNPVSG